MDELHQLSETQETMNGLRQRHGTRNMQPSSSSEESVEEYTDKEPLPGNGILHKELIAEEKRSLLRRGSVGSMTREDEGFVSATKGKFRRKSHLDTDSPTTKQPSKRFFTRQASSVNDEDDVSADANRGKAHQSWQLGCIKDYFEDSCCLKYMKFLYEILFVGRFLFVFLAVAAFIFMIVIFILNSYQPDSDYVIIKQTTEQLRYYKTKLETFEKDGGTFFKIVSKIAPGVVAKTFFDYMRKEISRLSNEYNFSQSGFQNRVSITINTLVESEKKDLADGDKRLEFEMRTVKDVSLSELVPNEAAQHAIKTAGERVDTNEEGPMDVREETAACFGNRCLSRVFCINARKKMFCGCLPRFNSCPSFCGKSKQHYLHCDPIIRLHSNKTDVDTKKFISDQIKNLLSEATCGSHFLGWEMGLKYKKCEYYWCLTYEQPLSKDAIQNRKYRVLLAPKELIDAAVTKEPWEVFHQKQFGGYTKYCDRRWFHLRTMGQIIAAKAEARELSKSLDPADKRIADRTMGFLNTFFVGTVQVVAPDSQQGKPTTRLKDLLGGLTVVAQNNLRSTSSTGSVRVPKLSVQLTSENNY